MAAISRIKGNDERKGMTGGEEMMGEYLANTDLHATDEVQK